MAEEKPKKFIPPIQEIEKVIKAKRNRTATVCSDQRRVYGHCGICGYGELAFQGVDYCTECGNEQEVLTLSKSPWFDSIDQDKFKCHSEPLTYYRFGGRKMSYQKSLVERYGIRVCLACGAVEAPECPNCKRMLWKKEFQRYCRWCGYTKRG